MIFQFARNNKPSTRIRYDMKFVRNVFDVNLNLIKVFLKKMWKDKINVLKPQNQVTTDLNAGSAR